MKTRGLPGCGSDSSLAPSHIWCAMCSAAADRRRLFEEAVGLAWKVDAAESHEQGESK